MRDFNVFSTKKALPRMSWNRTNLYNLYRRQLGKLQRDTVFTRTEMTLFQQRWASKKLVRAFHGDFINEGTFKRWYLPKMLPDVRPSQPLEYTDDIGKFAGNTKVLDAQDKLRREQEDGVSEEIAPVGSLMFSEIERRIDVLIFRACMAQSVYDARRFVIHGYVLLNGKRHQNPNTRLAPGDMVSIDPSVLYWLKRKPADVRRDERKAANRAAKAAVIDAAHKKEPHAAEEGSSKEESTKANSELSSEKSEYSGKREIILRVPGTIRTRLNSGTYEKYSNVCTMPDFSAPWLFLPAYIEASYQTCSFIYVRHPTARPGYSEIPTPFDADGEIVRLAWEWYAKNRPRMRSKRQLAREPLNRQ